MSLLTPLLATAVIGWTGATKAESSGKPVDIRIGRQLFVDDQLIQSTEGVVRHWNKPVKAPDPVVWPGDGAGRGVRGGTNANLTCATDGGLWWDPTLRRYRLWYQADWTGDICYAESSDGLAWRYPDLGIVKGTNRVFADDSIDSWCVVPDYEAPNPYGEWKLHISEPGGMTADQLFRSSDGVHFSPLGIGGRSGDRSTAYYDPFRSRWVFSLRDGRKRVGRCRRYFASRTFGGDDCHWRWPGDKDASAAWPEPEEWLVATNRPNWSLYSFNAVAYESLMFGVMEVLYNTPNDNGDCAKVGLPKQTGLHFCFSRDGKTFVPRNEADIAPSGWGSGAWDTGYLSAIGGICVICGDRLRIYYSGLRGDGLRLENDDKGWIRNGMYSNGSIGYATLRRDGFAGLVADARGTIVTQPLAFDGSHLFVNAECRFGSVRAEILDADGQPIEGFAAADCRPLEQCDTTRRELVFRGGDLGALGNRGIRVRFILHCATLYSFWLSPSARGESRGYVAAGGPDYPGLKDM